jgi:type I restriction enzyme S subunit
VKDGGTALKRALRPAPSLATFIKGDVALEPEDGLVPGFSASGQDVWLPNATHSGPGLILSAVGARCGKVFLADGEWGVIANTAVFKPQPGHCPRFLWYLVNNEDFWERGGSAQPYVRVPETLGRKVWLPPFGQQRAIADYLDTETHRINQLINKKRRMIQLIGDRYRQATVEALLPCDSQDKLLWKEPVRPQSVLSYQMRALPKTWSVVPFSRITKLSNQVNSDSAAPLLSLTIRGETLPRPPDRQPPSADYLQRYRLVERGQLVVNPMWLSGGAIGISTEEGAVSPDYRVYELSDLVEKSFIGHLLRSDPYREQYQLLTRGADTFDRRVTKEDFSELLIPLPSVEEQRRICERLDLLSKSSEKLVSITETQIALLHEKRQSLITAAVTGDLQIPGVAA